MSNEIAVVKPTVRISGADVSDMYCLRITKRIGLQGSTCTMRYVAGNDVTGPVTLNRGSSYKQKQRVIVYDNSASKIWFHGWLTTRQDQHAQNVELWTATDDTLLMRDVPIRGCFYVDTLLDQSNELKFSSSLPTTFNPSGAWNCTGIDIGGTVYPVFTPTAIYGKAYEKPDADYSGDPNTDGLPEPWTPRRVLQYLRLVMHYDDILSADPVAYPTPARITGMTGTYETAINPDYLELTMAEITSLSGSDEGVDSPLVGDPLDRSMQQLTIQGDTLLGALDKALKAAGTHDIGTRYDTTSITGGKTLIDFKPIGFVTDGLNIDVQFNRTVDTQYGTVYDFSLREDSSETAEAVVVEGEPVKVETRIQYTGTSGTDTIVPAWTAQNLVSFQVCIYGDLGITTQSPGTWAVFPKEVGKDILTTDDYLLADGNNGTPPIRACTPEAVALARESYPTVLRAFTLKTQGDLELALEEPFLANGTMIHPRPLLAEQLQYYTWLAENVGDTRLRASLPIRLSIESQTGTGKYYDAPRDTAIRLTTNAQGDNLLWLDGAAEGADGTLYCMYNGSLYNESASTINDSKLTLRKFRINAAVATDYRTAGLSTKLAPEWLSTDYQDAFAGSTSTPTRYLDRPGSFREYLQYNSYPAANSEWIDGSGPNLTAPLTREVPPGSERENANYAAQREMSRRGNPNRTSTWMQAGIQAGFDAGDWIKYAYIWENGQNVTNYLVNGVIRSVVYDFLSQNTRVGDVYNEFGSAI